MTKKETLILRKLSYSAFGFYMYIKHNPTASNKDIEFDLGYSRQSIHRAQKILRSCNIIKNIGKRSNGRIFTILPETEWALHE